MRLTRRGKAVIFLTTLIIGIGIGIATGGFYIDYSGKYPEVRTWQP